MSKTDAIFMFIPAVHGSGSKCFEEVRIDDYIKAYSTTGRPPQPCPDQPTGEQERLILGLPPLFQPHTESSVSGTTPQPTPPLSISTSTRVVNPLELPAAQAFHATPHQGETLQSITCMSGFTGFSHEELRYYAYLRGNKLPPTSVPMDPFVPTQFPKSQTSTSASVNIPPPTVAAADPGDRLQNISTQPGFTGHSQEEFRVMFLLSGGRELTSAQIIQAQQGHLPPPTPASLAAAPTLILPLPPVTPIAQKSSVFGFGALVGGRTSSAGASGLFGTPAATASTLTTGTPVAANLFGQPQSTPSAQKPFRF